MLQSEEINSFLRLLYGGEKMAQRFNLTAQINLQSPKNVGKVVSDIQRQLKGSGLNTVNIKVKADPRSMAQTNKQLQNVTKIEKS